MLRMFKVDLADERRLVGPRRRSGRDRRAPRPHALRSAGCRAAAAPPQVAAALLGLPLATYTAALIANTAVPVWHEARRELPFVFAAGAAASAGAAATVAHARPRDAGPARRLAVGGAVAELAARS